MIGTGIFTLTGIEARNHAGPAIVVSFAIAGVVSMLAALCYAELAAAVPTAGSCYTYAYTTIGEIFAWIIAWDLILEFALGAAVVSRGWSAYLQDAWGCRPACSGSPRRSTSAPCSSPPCWASWPPSGSASPRG